MGEDAVQTVRFAGRDWQVKVSTDAVGPGPNVFSAQNVAVDSRGRLQLRIARSFRGWTCAEVVGLGHFGYGTYRWSVSSDVTGFAPPAVLGLFTWSDESAQAHRELDIEFSRWGSVRDPVRGSYALHRMRPPSPKEFRFAPAPGPAEHTLERDARRVRFRSDFGGLLHGWEHVGSDVPSPGGGVAPRMNLWLFRGNAPAAQHSVTIADFAYTAR